jgi:hypothetical protein
MSSTTIETDAIYKGRHYALAILVVIYTFNFIDRQILSILLEPVKSELGLSDTAMGMLTGFAFAMFYATFGHSNRPLRRPHQPPQLNRRRFGYLEYFHRAFGSGAKLLASLGRAYRRRRRRSRLLAPRALDDCRLLSGRTTRHSFGNLFSWHSFWHYVRTFCWRLD